MTELDKSADKKYQYINWILVTVPTTITIIQAFAFPTSATRILIVLTVASAAAILVDLFLPKLKKRYIYLPIFCFVLVANWLIISFTRTTCSIKITEPENNAMVSDNLVLGGKKLFSFDIRGTVEGLETDQLCIYQQISGANDWWKSSGGLNPINLETGGVWRSSFVSCGPSSKPHKACIVKVLAMKSCPEANEKFDENARCQTEAFVYRPQKAGQVQGQAMIKKSSNCPAQLVKAQYTGSLKRLTLHLDQNIDPNLIESVSARYNIGSHEDLCFGRSDQYRSKSYRIENCSLELRRRPVAFIKFSNCQSNIKIEAGGSL